MSASPDPSQLVLLGTITSPRGIRGEVRIKSFTEVPSEIAAYNPLWDAKAERQFRIKVTGEAKGQVVARIKGVDDRNGAEALKGVGLFVPRDRLPAPDEDEFYHVDLIGLRDHGRSVMRRHMIPDVLDAVLLGYDCQGVLSHFFTSHLGSGKHV